MRKRMTRIKKQMRWYCAAMAALVLVLAAGCGPAARPASSGEGGAGKQIVVAVASDPALDQLDAGTYGGAIMVHPMVYDSLVEYGDKGSIVPSLAESWDLSDDGRTYIFHLRSGVVFSDGTPLDAAAVKFSFERWYWDPAFSSLNVATGLQNIKVIDGATIQFTFKEPFYPLLTEMAFARPVRIISPSAVEPFGDPDGRFTKPIGTGAWMVDGYTKDQEAVLVRNPAYWGDAPQLEKIVLKVIPDAQSRVLALQSGAVDISGGEAGTIPFDNLELLRADPQLSVQQAAGTSSHFLIFNENQWMLQDVSVRRAINLAIDKQSIVGQLLGGAGQEAQGLFPLTVPYITERNNRWYGHDLDEARRLLQEAGYADSDGDGALEKDGRKLELKLVLQQAEYPEWKPIAEAVQSQLQAVGIQVQLQVLEPNAYYDTLWKSRKYDLILYRTYSDAYNPHAFLLSLFHQTGGTPAVAWSDAQLEALFDQALVSTDTGHRQALYDQWFARAKEEAIYAPIYYPDDIFVVNQRVRNFKPGYTTYAPIAWNELQVEY
ncbi:nickel ABC transporter substrate-binding protein [Paenibacillus thiaminolyticus]|uniref:nickel ABC transporter substrate-binding protein n=1 Tax=Paenibacillus thiaminolyticus TaxID=49283 RepID=UPI002542782D|nr:nickel ABC transporter substrate-binding protein [Paenibacillus thiaminolyticus]WII35138.1 nickel ABC transporter substrate-binding protein [Paenibacillus thiaminolyticus]